MRVLAALFCLMATGPLLARDTGEPMVEANALLDRGQTKAAFAAYLRIPGAEHAALRVALQNPAEYLALLEKETRVPKPRRLLLQGDLHLALGDKRRALDCYREVARRTGSKPDENWRNDFIPTGYYFVEPPPSGGIYHLADRGAVAPYTRGPGSHRDNWLLRRFLALGAREEAEREWNRIAEAHRLASRPHVANLGQFDPKIGHEVVAFREVFPSGFNSTGLLFTIDHAYFWKRQGNLGRAMALLLEPLAGIDLEHGADRFDLGPPLPLGRPYRFPVQNAYYARGIYSGVGYGFGFGLQSQPPTGFHHVEYLRLAFGLFRDAGREADFTAVVGRLISEGSNPARLILARLRMIQGRPAEAAALEIEHLEHLKEKPAESTLRRGRIYKEHLDWSYAAAAFEKLLARPECLPKGERISEMLDDLEVFYGALARPDKLRDLELRRLEVEPDRLADISALLQAENLFRSAGQSERFRGKLRLHVKAARSPLIRAGLLWVLEEHREALGELAKAAADPEVDDNLLKQWHRRIVHEKPEFERPFLQATVSARPNAVGLRRRHLELQGELDTAKEIPLLEAELAATNFERYPEAEQGFGKLFRLCRLTEKIGEAKRMVPLVRKLLAGEAPFAKVALAAHLEREPSYLFAALLIALPHLDNADVHALLGLARRLNHLPLQNQIGRRLSGWSAIRIVSSADTGPGYRKMEVRTLGIESGSRLLANTSRRTCSTSDGTWFGTEWGLLRKRALKDRLEILQIPIGERVRTLGETPSGLFALTTSEVWWIESADAATPTVRRIPLVVESRTRRTDSFGLLWWKDRLWINQGGTLHNFDPRRGEIRFFGEATRDFFVFANRLWCGQSVYDPLREAFCPIRAGSPTVELIGATSREVWAEVETADGWRLATFDPASVFFRIVPIENLPPHEVPNSDPGARIREETHGRIRLQRHDALFEYDRRTEKLTRTDEVRNQAASNLPGSTGLPAGLPSAEVTSVALDAEEKRLFVATRGGLVILSLPDHGILHRLGSADGLLSEEIGELTREGDRLTIGCRHRWHPYTMTLDLKSGLLRWLLPETEPRSVFESIPIGKPCVSRTGVRYSPTRAGLLIHDAKTEGRWSFPIAKVVRVPTREKVLRAEAERAKGPETPEQLATALRDGNPYLRAKALQHACDFAEADRQTCVAILERAVVDSHREVREAALKFLRLTDTPSRHRMLQTLAADPVRQIRCGATYALGLSGVRPTVAQAEELLHHGFESENPVAAIAPHANRRLFALLLRYPHVPQSPMSEEDQALFRVLGRRLRENPDLAGMLLADPRLAATPNVQAFVANVFARAGRGLLPTLLAGLKSADRIERANAARLIAVCGGAEAIEPLRNALALESGVSRAAIVAALGTLRARQALPDLYRLHAELARDPGAGFRAGQLGGTYDSQYRRISSLDELAGDWRGLLWFLQNRKPMREEADEEPEILDTRILLGAIEEIGPRHSQVFYRRLTGQPRFEDGLAAAIHLSNCGTEERAEHIRILGQLLRQPNHEIAQQAAVSLLLLGSKDGEKAILDWLEPRPYAIHWSMLKALERVTDRKRLAFAEKALRKIAEMPAKDNFLRQQVRHLLGQAD